MPRLVRFPRVACTGVAAVALTVLASTATASTATATASPAFTAVEPPASSLTLSDPRIVAHFDFQAGETPENIALEPDGSANLTFAFAGKVVRVAENGDTQPVATLPAVTDPATPLIGAALAMGIVRTGDGSLYVNYLTGHEEQTGVPTGVYRIAPDGAVELFAALPAGSFANGLALDKKHGVLYAADSVLGKVWRISLDDATVTTWATGTALEPAGSVGANGIKVHRGAVWVSNSDRGTLLRIPVNKDGSAGAIETRATGVAGIDDFAFPGPGGSAIAALHPTSQVALVRPDGTHSILLNSEAGLSNPTSVAVRRDKVYVPSAAYTTQTDPNLLLARLDKGHS
ncbi:SMP-30/gluconolactonase/LRE family protein [Streptomyces sp. LARHCF249]